MSDANGPGGAGDGGAAGQGGKDFLVVGLGASAGGLKALKDFFTQMPAESGMAFVVILHLSPQHESHAASILQTTTRMPVIQVNETVKVEPNSVYVIPPTMHLQMADGHINLSAPERLMGRHVAVDLFFRTLADTHQSRAVCIVLSGTGADGAVGIRRVKEAGGISIAQEPGDAEYDSMPRNAINTGMVDFVLPVSEMPDKLLALRRNALQIQLPAEAEAPVVDESKAAEAALREALSVLRSRTGYDFTHYKRATVLRRIERRMQVTTVQNLPAYRDYLRANVGEAQLLLKDLLIGVTNFFRDRTAFDAFEREVVPRLFEGKAAGDQVRVWVAGCATGEEAYSVAILLLEHAATLTHPPDIQIFATDIDDEAIAAAREGDYPEAIEADVAPVRLRQFFTKEPGGYRIGQQVRERVLFASHNRIKDPPFSKLDAVTCRNLLIYLNREVQEQVFELFHFALRPGGFLFLGTSESADGSPELFTPVDKKRRLFRAAAVTRRHRAFPALPLEVPPARGRGERGRDAGGERRRLAFSELHQQLLEQYAPPSVIVTAEYEIVHLSEHAGRFLQLAGGEPSLNLLRAVRPELRLELRTALFQAMRTGLSTEARRVRLALGGRDTYVNMIVRPVLNAEAGGDFALVIFHEVEETFGEEGREPEAGERAPVVRGLEEELARTREQLRSTVEQYETTVEELKASNEELQAINEELRSTGEELETSKEELQSVNEELRTVNQELKNKVEEVSETNDDLSNLISATEIATVFLDRSLRVKRYTPYAVGLFSLIPSDVGRPLADLMHHLDYAELHADAAETLATLARRERAVATRDGRYYLARLLPYRTAQDKIDGVVLNFLDITERKRAEEALRESEQRLRLATEAAGMYTWELDVAAGTYKFSENAGQVLGLEAENLPGTVEDALAVVHPDDRQRFQEALAESLQTGESFTADLRSVRQSGETIWLSMQTATIKGAQGHDVRFYGIAQDITRRKQAEEQVRRNEERLRLLMESVADYAIFTLDAEGRIEHWNTGAERMFGFTAAAALGQHAAIIFTPEDRERGVPEEEMRQARETGRASDDRWHVRQDGSRFYVSGVLTPLQVGGTVGYVKVARDLTAHKALEETLEGRVREQTGELAEAVEWLQREIAERKAAEVERVLLMQRLVTTQEDERRRIARDLHDQLGQQTTALRLKLDALKERIELQPERAGLRAEVEDLRALAERLDAEVDFLAWELRPAALDDLGLVIALDNYVSEWSKHFGVAVEFHSILSPDSRLPSMVETVCYRVAQEALTNVAKHAGASRVEVILESRDGRAVLVIEDDGAGFEVPGGTAQAKRLGLAGIRERTTLAGGTFEIESVPGEGTTVFVRIPINATES